MKTPEGVREAWKSLRTSVVTTMTMRNVRSYAEVGSYISQILLLVLAIFGYFYTVRPIYQRDYLEEEIAQSQLRIEAENKKEAALQDQLQNSQKQLVALENTIQESTSRNNSLLKDNGGLERDRDALRQEIQVLLSRQQALANNITILRKGLLTPSGHLAESSSDVKAALWLEYLQSMETTGLYTLLWSYNDTISLVTYDDIPVLQRGEKQFINENSAMYKDWKQSGDKAAIQIIADSLKTIKIGDPGVNGVNASELQSEFYNLAAKVLADNTKALLCPVDLDNINKRFMADVQVSSTQLQKADAVLTEKYKEIYANSANKPYLEIYQSNERIERLNARTDFINGVDNGKDKGVPVYKGEVSAYTKCLSDAFKKYQALIQQQTPASLSTH